MQIFIGLFKQKKLNLLSNLKIYPQPTLRLDLESTISEVVREYVFQKRLIPLQFVVRNPSRDYFIIHNFIDAKYKLDHQDIQEIRLNNLEMVGFTTFHNIPCEDFKFLYTAFLLEKQIVLYSQDYYLLFNVM